MKRHLALAAIAWWLCLPSSAIAASRGGDGSADSGDEGAEDDFPPKRAEAPDLRAGHWLISISGGVWVPSAGLYPTIGELGSIDVGQAAEVDVGLGLGRYLVLNLLSGGFGHGGNGGSTTGCTSCALWSFQTGPSIELHPAQGFAFDPWVSYGLGYRHNVAVLGSGDEKVLGMDVAKLALGGTWYPDPFIGFGPLLELDVGVRTSGAISGYALLTAGLRVSFDPLAAGTSFSPNVAAR